MMELLAFLHDHGIEAPVIEHPAVFTCAESEKLPPMPGEGTKNLFLTNEEGNRIFLVSVQHGRRVKMNHLAKLLGERRARFGNQELLKELLGVDPGSVTLLGLMCDTNHRVEVFIDKKLYEAEKLQCHPLRNTATVILTHSDLEKFLSATGHSATVIDVPYDDEAKV
jgi:Ala-tRNA(Pro) deacylase